MSRNTHDFRLDHHNVGAPVIYAECNSPGSAGASTTRLVFDFFYDTGINVLDPDTDFPTSLGLIYDDSIDVFEATESGIWMVNLWASLTATPAQNGTITFQIPSYNFSPYLLRRTTSIETDGWINYAVIAHPGDAFYVEQRAPAGTASLTDYVSVEIIRIGGDIEG